MRVSKLPALTILCAYLVGCAGSLPPSGERRVQFVEEVKSSKANIYQKALVHFTKTFGDSKETIKLQDKETGQIVAKGHASCVALRQWGDPSEYLVRFTLDFEAKDNKFRLAFEDLVMLLAKDLEPVTWGYQQVSTPERLEKVKTQCLEPLKSNLLKSIGGGTSGDW